MSVTYIIKDGLVFFESEDKDNPLFPHIDSEGESIADFQTPFLITQGATIKVVHKTVTLFCTGKKGNGLKIKLPTELIFAMCSAIEEMSTDSDHITKDTINNIDQAIEGLTYVSK